MIRIGSQPPFLRLHRFADVEKMLRQIPIAQTQALGKLAESHRPRFQKMDDLLSNRHWEKLPAGGNCPLSNQKLLQAFSRRVIWAGPLLLIIL